jgi:uncharacterized membrane protein (UPF0127 family)
MTKKKLIQTETNKTVVQELIVASELFTRAIGLLGRKSISDDFGMMFPKCRSIHTHFMLFAIDIVFTDEQNCITELYSNLKPWKILIATEKESYNTIELATGKISKENLSVGTQLGLTEIKCQK